MNDSHSPGAPEGPEGTDRLSDLLDRSFGDGPPAPSIARDLAGGHRALRRRRLTVGAGGVAAVAVIAALAITFTGGGTDTGAVDPGPADRPTPTASSTAAEHDLDGFEPLTIDDDGGLVPGAGVEVLETIDNPLHRQPPRYSVAATYRYEGREWYWLGTVNSPTRGGYSQDPVGKAMGSLEAWVESQTPRGRRDTDTLVRLADDGRLTPGPGTTILEQRSPISVGASFADGSAPTAAALVERDGTRWWLLARHLPGGPPEYFPVSYRVGGSTMADFLAHSRAQYDSGEGLK